MGRGHLLSGVGELLYRLGTAEQLRHTRSKGAAVLHLPRKSELGCFVPLGSGPGQAAEIIPSLKQPPKEQLGLLRPQQCQVLASPSFLLPETSFKRERERENIKRKKAQIPTKQRKVYLILPVNHLGKALLCI